MNCVNLQFEPSLAFAMMDEWSNAPMIQDLEYLDLDFENGTWHARVTATSGGVNYRGCGFGPTRDMAKENASNAALASLHQGSLSGP
jgi:hypothetical protein